MIRYVLLFITLFTNSIFSQLSKPYPFIIPYYSEEFFLQPMINYDQSLEWKKNREAKLYSGGMVQMSYGSLTTHELMNNEEVLVNSEIGKDFLFRFRYRNHENHYLSYNENSLTTGFGYKFNESFAILTETDLTYQKAEIDLKPGLLYKNNFIQTYLGLVFEDFLFDMKNTDSGTNSTTPLKICTDLKFDYNSLYFFISANYATGINRHYSKPNPSGLIKHKNYIRNIYARFEYDFNEYLRAFSENYWDDFYDAKNMNDPKLIIKEYDFKAKVRENKLGFIYMVDNQNCFNIDLTLANATHSFNIIDGLALNSDKVISYPIKYSVVMPHFSYNYRFFDSFKIELAYMGSYVVGTEKSYFLIKSQEHF